jgi:hypothetical protein
MNLIAYRIVYSTAKLLTADDIWTTGSNVIHLIRTAGDSTRADRFACLIGTRVRRFAVSTHPSPNEHERYTDEDS